MTRKLTKPVAKKPMVSTAPPALIADLRQLIAKARQSVAAAVNAGLTLLYWRIGKRIVNEVLGQERAAYGQQIVVSLARQLVDEHGPSFGEKNLGRMMQFAEAHDCPICFARAMPFRSRRRTPEDQLMSEV